MRAIFLLLMVLLAGCLDSDDAPRTLPEPAEDWSVYEGCDWTYWTQDALPFDDPCQPDVPARSIAGSLGTPGPQAQCIHRQPVPGLQEDPDIDWTWSWWWRNAISTEEGGESGFQLGLQYDFPSRSGPLLGTFQRVHTAAGDTPQLFHWDDHDWSGFVWFNEIFQDRDVEWRAVIMHPEPTWPDGEPERWQTMAAVMAPDAFPDSFGTIPVAQVVHEGQEYFFPYSSTPVYGDASKRELAGGGHWGLAPYEKFEITRDAPDALNGTVLPGGVRLHGHSQDFIGLPSACCSVVILDDPVEWIQCSTEGIVPDGPGAWAQSTSKPSSPAPTS